MSAIIEHKDQQGMQGKHVYHITIHFPVIVLLADCSHSTLQLTSDSYMLRLLRDKHPLRNLKTLKWISITLSMEEMSKKSCIFLLVQSEELFMIVDVPVIL